MSSSEGHIGTRLRLLRGAKGESGATTDGGASDRGRDAGQEAGQPAGAIASSRAIPPTGTSVLIVGPEPATRVPLRALFENEWGWSVVGEAGDGLEALAITRMRCPELIITEATLPDMALDDMAALVDQTGSGSVLLALVDFPHQRVPGVTSFVKGAPLAHLRAVALEALAAAAAVRNGFVPSSPAAPAPAPYRPAVTTGADPLAPVVLWDRRAERIAARAVAHERAAVPEPMFELDREDPGREAVLAETMSLAARAVADSSPAFRDLALEVLQQAPEQASIESLRSFAVDPDPTVRRHAYDVVCASGRPEAVAILADRVVTESDEDMRASAISRLAGLLTAFDSATRADHAEIVHGALAELAPEVTAAHGTGLETLADLVGEPARGSVAVDAPARKPGSSAEVAEDAIPSLLAAVAHPDSELRTAARAALEAVGTTALVEWLENHREAAIAPGASDALRSIPAVAMVVNDGLTSIEKSVRARTFHLAGRLGMITTDILASGLTDPASQVRVAAAEAVGSIDDASGALLTAVLQRDTSPDVALAALGALAGADADFRVTAAKAAVGHPDGRVRRAGITLLPRDADSIELVSRALVDCDATVAEAAIAALAECPPAETIATLWSRLHSADPDEERAVLAALIRIDSGVVGRMARRALESPAPAERVLGIRTLVGVGVGSSDEAVRRALVDPVGEVRIAAVQAVAEHPTAVPIEDLGGRVRDPAAEVRASVVEALATLDDDRALVFLLEAARDPAFGIRSRARQVLAERTTPAVAERLVRYLADPLLRPVAAELLGDMGEVPIDAMARVLVDADGPTQEAVLAILTRPEAVGRLVGALSDAKPEHRRSALLVLAALRHPAALDGLILRLEDPDRELRRLSCTALRDLGDPRAIPALRWTLASDPDPAVAAAAEEALRRLATGGPPKPAGRPNGSDAD